MNIKHCLVLVGLIASQGCTFAKKITSVLVTVDNLSLLEKETAFLGPDDMVIFDVDDVLLAKEDAIFHLGKEHKQLFQKLFGSGSRMSALSDVQKKHLESIYIAQRPYVLVDKKMPKIIEKYQKKGVKAIALTAIDGGKKGVIECRADWRYDQLKKEGIDFSKSFPLDEPLLFHPGKLSFGATLQPLLKFIVAKRGIVCVGSYAKGPALTAFLKQVKWKLRRIIFIDDNRAWVKSVS